jgi:hypothetical protein
MKRVLLGSVVLVAAAILGGCGGADPDAGVKESIAAMNDLAADLEKSKTAAEAKPKVDAYVTRVNDITKRFNKDTKLSGKEVDKKYAADLQKATERLADAMKNLALKDPTNFGSIAASMEKMGEAASKK